MEANKEMEPRRAASLERALAKAERYRTLSKAKREADDAWFDAAVIAWANSDEKRDAELAAEAEETVTKKAKVSEIENVIGVVALLGGVLGSWVYCLYFGYAPVYVAVMSGLLFVLLRWVSIWAVTMVLVMPMVWLFNVLSGK